MTAIKSRVVLIPCENYDIENVYTKLKEGFSLWGDLSCLVKPEEKVLFKPNLLKKSTPDQAAVTHPAVLEAAARIFRENGYGYLEFGDSPGTGNFGKVASEAGMMEGMKRQGVMMGDFEQGVRIEYPKGRLAKSFILAKAVAEKPAIINICKMKTHALERMTGAVKNMYGCIYGFNKAAGHTIYSDADSFARMLIDLNQCVKPRFCIMDGIVAMEGNGPGSGTPVPMHVLLMASDFVALDSVCCYLMNLKPELVPTNVFGEQMGYGTYRPENITVVTPDGDISPEEAGRLYGKVDFDVYRGNQAKPFWRRLNKAMRFMQQRPFIKEERCIRCGICVDACPVEGKAVNFQEKGKPPVYDYKKCIGCFCCQEMCPKKAILVHTPRLRRLADKIRG